MDLFGNLAIGFATAMEPANLSYCFVGCAIGTLIGVLPGIGPAAAIAMLLPATHALSPVAALMLLAGIYYGAQYAASTPAILANRAGASSSVITCIDGHQMARQGRGGAAIAAAALGSFVAGCVGTLVLALCASPVAELAFRFGPAEYFSLVVAGLVGAVVFASGSVAKAIGMAVLGVLIGWLAAGTDAGVARANLLPVAHDGPQLFAMIAIGMLVLGEMMVRLSAQEPHGETPAVKLESLLPTQRELRAIVPPVLRGTLVGSVLGVLPGGGALLASFAAYAIERRVPPRNGEVDFGKGNIRGVAAPESANNAGAQTSFIPLLTLGLPSNAVMALMVGAMAIHGIAPGPQVMTSQPQLFWGLIASMWIGNVMLVLLNLPLVRLWARVAALPYRWLFPAVVLLCAIGVYSIAGDTADVWLVAGFAFIGYLLIHLGCEPAPLLLGFILGPPLEENLRRALQLSNGDWSVFATRPLSAGLLAAAALLLVFVALPSVGTKRAKAFADD